MAKGFTLIELVVVISIIAILTGGGLAVFSGFRSGRAALSDAQTVVDVLNEAKRLAVSAEKPTECSAVTLQGYSVVVDATSLDLSAACLGGSPPTKTKNLTSGAVVGAPFSATFKVLTGSTQARTVDVCSQGHLFRISITTAGSVSEPLEVAGGC